MKKIFMGLLCVCMLLGFTACHKQEEIKTEEKILMVNGKLYYGTEEKGPMGDAGCIGGKIVSSVASDQVPTQEGQSNFGGVGNSYTKVDGEDGIMVFVDDEWTWFYAKQ